MDGQELTLDELELVSGGSDFLFQLQSATAAQQQNQTQTSNTLKGQSATTYAILRNLRG